MVSTFVRKKRMTRKKETDKKRKYNRIADVLNERERSQAWLSRKSGVSTNSINKICRNESQPGLPILFQIAEALQVDPCKLLGDGSELN